MIGKLLLDTYYESSDSGLFKQVLVEIKQSIENIDKSKIDEEKSNLNVSNETINLCLISSPSDLHATIRLEMEDNHANITFGKGDVFFVEDALLKNSDDINLLFECLNELLTTRIKEVCWLRKNEIVKSICTFESNNRSRQIGSTKFIHQFNLLINPIGLKKEEYHYREWVSQ